MILEAIHCPDCDRDQSQNRSTPDLEDILAADVWARQEVLTASQALIAAAH